MLHIFESKTSNPKSLLSRFLGNLGIGRLAFHLRTLLFKLDNVRGHFNQRFIEYPWILEQLKHGEGKTLLDVGCTGSLLDHELLARGYHVIGLDLSPHSFRNNREKFIQANILKNGLDSNLFDVVVVASVLEHVGLRTYGQQVIDDNADLEAMQEFHRILKLNGILVLTMPYEGKGPCYVFHVGNLLERRYDSARLERLLEGFEVVDSAYFLCLLKLKCHFVQVSKAFLDRLSNRQSEGSLACLVLRKNSLSF